MPVSVLECGFDAGHAAAEGHFPGDPIIPGAVVLCEALLALEAGGVATPAPLLVRWAKFFHPVRPGDRMRIECSGPEAGGGPDSATGRTRIACSVQGRPVLAAELQCGEARIP